jgi:hypothetical protein
MRQARMSPCAAGGPRLDFRMFRLEQVLPTQRNPVVVAHLTKVSSRHSHREDQSGSEFLPIFALPISLPFVLAPRVTLAFLPLPVVGMNGES